MYTIGQGVVCQLVLGLLVTRVIILNILKCVTLYQVTIIPYIRFLIRHTLSPDYLVSGNYTILSLQ